MLLADSVRPSRLSSKPCFCIYQIRCTATGRRYVGSTSSFSRRMYEHLLMLMAGNHHSIKLQRAFNKYGVSCFTCTNLASCDSQEDAISQEQLLLNNNFRGLYNCSKTAGHPSPRLMPPIYGHSQFDVVKFRTAEQAASFYKVGLSSIRKSLYRQRKSCGRYWTYDKAQTWDSLQPIAKDRFFAFESSGRFVASFSNINDAANWCGVSVASIYQCMSPASVARTAGGFFWSKTELAPDLKCRRTKPIIQVLENGERVRWPSSRNAAKELGLNYKAISDALNGRSKSSGGCRWEFEQTSDCSERQC